MTADSFLADVATQVVAWHNRHPLARRITRKDVQGIGLVELPFARDGLPAWDAPQPKRGLLSLMFAPRQSRRGWPVFSEDLLPEIGVKRVVAFARRHGYDDRPGPAGLPERVAAFDRDLLDPPKPAAQAPERVPRYLVTAAIDIGPQRPRVLLGRGRRPPVLGQRLWSLPRLAAVGAALLLAMLVGVALLWLKAMPTRGGHGGTAGAASAAAAASVAAPASAATARSAPSGAMPSPSPSASASASASVSAASAAAAGASASAARPSPVPAAPATPAASVTLAVPAPAPASMPGAAPAPLPASAALARPAAASAAPPTSAALPAPAASAVQPPPPVEVQQASAPLVPRLRPDLAASARAEAGGLPMAPRQASGPATGPALLPESGSSARAVGTPPSAAASAPRFYALVTRPVRTKAEAEALLRRLRAETDRIDHPTATQTGLLESREGWRVTWWPFTNPRQAENARVALARRIQLEVVDF